MAQRSPSESSIDSLNLSESNLSMKSSDTSESRRSTSSTLYSSVTRRRHHGFLSKFQTGFQTIFRRVSGSSKVLSESEIQILLTITNFTREEILKW